MNFQKWEVFLAHPIEVLFKTLSKGFSKNSLEGFSKQPASKGFLKSLSRGFPKTPL